MKENYYYSGQGRFYVAERDSAGRPKGFRALGNVPSAEISIEVTKFEHKESMSGSRAVDLTIVQEKNGTFTITLESFNYRNLAMALWGDNAVVSSAAAFNDVFMGYPGGKLRLQHVNLDTATPLTLEDTAGTPTQYVIDTDFTVDYPNGTITPVAGGQLETDLESAGDSGLELSATYDHKGYLRVDAFKKTSLERWLRFEGLNTVDGMPVVVDIFKASIDPLQGMGLINEEIGSVELNGNLLLDDLRDEAGGSQFFEERFAEDQA